MGWSRHTDPTRSERERAIFSVSSEGEPSIYREIMADMKGTPTRPGKSAVYPIVRSEIRTYSHPNDDRHFECNNPFQGQVPNRLIVAMCLQGAFNGSIRRNPFRF